MWQRIRNYLQNISIARLIGRIKNYFHNIFYALMNNLLAALITGFIAVVFLQAVGGALLALAAVGIKALKAFLYTSIIVKAAISLEERIFQRPSRISAAVESVTTEMLRVLTISIGVVKHIVNRLLVVPATNLTKKIGAALVRFSTIISNSAIGVRISNALRKFYRIFTRQTPPPPRRTKILHEFLDNRTRMPLAGASGIDYYNYEVNFKKLTSIRELSDSDVQNLIADIRAHGLSDIILRKFNLRGYDMSPASMREFAKFIKESAYKKVGVLSLLGKNLDDAKLQAFIAELTTVAEPATNENPNHGDNISIAVLDLSASSITDAGLPHIAALMQHVDITALHMSGCKLSDQGLTTMVDAAEQANYANVDKLRILDLKGNSITSAGASSVVKLLQNSALDELDLSHNEIESAGGIEIVTAVCDNNLPLMRLNMSDNRIWAAARVALANLLQHRRLDLRLTSRINHLSQEGGHAVNDVLLDNEAAETLNLEMLSAANSDKLTTRLAPQSNFRVTGVNLVCLNSQTDLEAVATVVGGNQQVTHFALEQYFMLNIHGHFSLSPTVANILAPGSALKSVTFRYIKADNTGGVRALAANLAVNNSIEMLTIKSAEINDTEAAYIAQAVRKHKTLKRLDLSSNQIGFYGAYELAKALEENSSVTDVNLRGNSFNNGMFFTLPVVKTLQQVAEHKEQARLLCYQMFRNRNVPDKLAQKVASFLPPTVTLRI